MTSLDETNKGVSKIKQERGPWFGSQEYPKIPDGAMRDRVK